MWASNFTMPHTQSRGRRRLGVLIVMAAFALASAVISASPAVAVLYPGGCMATGTVQQTVLYQNWCWAGSDDAAYDRYGDYTVGVQRIVSGKGFNPNGIDGDFGPGTAGAVSSYQSSRGLGADGVVGGQTWNKMLATDISYCSFGNQGYPYNGVRIGVEACGQYLQRGTYTGTFWVLRFTNGAFIQMTTNGPSA